MCDAIPYYDVEHGISEIIPKHKLYSSVDLPLPYLLCKPLVFRG